MRRAIPWLGLFLLAISFVWFIRLSTPPSLPTAGQKPAACTAPPLVVVLDPGHGGQDSGAMCGTVLEKDLTLDVALRAELLLRAVGFSTVLTRDDDRYVSLAERASLGNRENNSLFVSIHFNDNKCATASGVETYYALRPPAAPLGFFSWLSFLQRGDVAPLTTKSESLAGFIQAALVERTRAVNRGTKPERFFVIANVRHPAALVEGGFLTNKSDLTKLATTEYRQEIASAVCDGVQRYWEGSWASKPVLSLAAAQPE
jgi:N-acetylmuramoyl-L-alanine amidase